MTGRDFMALVNEHIDKLSDEDLSIVDEYADALRPMAERPRMKLAILKVASEMISEGFERAEHA